jgi:hypothetical protein
MTETLYGLNAIHEVPDGWYWYRHDSWGYEVPVVILVTQFKERTLLNLPYPDEYSIIKGEHPNHLLDIKLIGPLEVPTVII